MPDIQINDDDNDKYEDYAPPFERDIMQDSDGFRVQEKGMLNTPGPRLTYSSAADIRREALTIAAQVITSPVTNTYNDPYEVINLANDIERYLSEGAVPKRAATPEDPV